MDIQTLRKMRNQDFGKIAQEFDKIANPSTESKSYQDDRLWKLDPDKAGNATAVIRFLPRTEGDELPWVRIFNHSFQGPTGKWYIENSLTTLGEKDPVGELNSKLWNSGSEANKEIARKQKRKLTYIANVLIVSDPKHPENEGQIRLFRFGKKIFDKIMDKAKPTFEDEKPVNVFDLWEGADFKLRMRKVDGYANYDQSQFMEPSALFSGDEDQLLELVSKQHKLSDFTDQKNFKTFEELSRKLADVLDDSGGSVKSAASMSEDAPSSYEPPVHRSVAAKPIPEKVAVAAEGDDDEDMMSYFQKIANEK
jgi:hypothetical protein